MAEPGNIGGGEREELRELSSFRGRLGYQFLRKHLSIEEIRSKLNALRNVNDSGRMMIYYIQKVNSHHFQHLQVPFAVTNLRHDTEEDGLKSICEIEGFRADKNRFSYWSAEVSSGDVESARQQAYELVRRCKDAEIYEEDIKNQVSNSLAFDKHVSRYGNFQFSFPLKYLLDQYKAQHCGGKEPQLRILGTEIYKMKIAHYIVVHSPDTGDIFNDHPIVPSVQANTEVLPFVYWKDGTLYWRPESTSKALQVKISQDGSFIKECYEPCSYFTRFGTCGHLDDGIYSVWNHLTFAFHLQDGLLEIPRGKLLKNLAACGTDAPYLGSYPLTREKANEIVLTLKDTYTGNSDLD